MKRFVKRPFRLFCLAFALLLCFCACAQSVPALPSGAPTEQTQPSSQPTDETGFSAVPLQLDGGDLMAKFTANAPQDAHSAPGFEEAQTAFDLALFKALAKENGGKNMVISPFSVMLALSMTANGAAGRTAEEMVGLLGGELSLDQLNEGLYLILKRLTDRQSALTFANAIFFDDAEGFSVLPSFLQTNADYYNAGAFKMPFGDEALAAINAWVKEHTNGRIEKILDDLSDNARMVLLNALAFDAEWREGYTEQAQKEAVFHGAGGDETSVMMVSNEDLFLSDGRATGFIKPYKNGFSFAALLPNEGISLDDYIASLDAESLRKTLTGAKSVGVSAGLPKFDCTCGELLNGALCALGMPTAFGGAADFSKIDGRDDLYIGRVVHKCTISVDNLGTKAGAATAVELVYKGMPQIEKTVILDRPFLYMILDDATGLPVFMGTVNSVR